MSGKKNKLSVEEQQMLDLENLNVNESILTYNDSTYMDDDDNSDSSFPPPPPPSEDPIHRGLFRPRGSATEENRNPHLNKNGAALEDGRPHYALTIEQADSVETVDMSIWPNSWNKWFGGKRGRNRGAAKGSSGDSGGLKCRLCCALLCTLLLAGAIAGLAIGVNKMKQNKEIDREFSQANEGLPGTVAPTGMVDEGIPFVEDEAFGANETFVEDEVYVPEEPVGVDVDATVGGDFTGDDDDGDDFTGNDDAGDDFAGDDDAGDDFAGDDFAGDDFAGDDFAGDDDAGDDFAGDDDAGDDDFAGDDDAAGDDFAGDDGFCSDAVFTNGECYDPASPVWVAFTNCAPEEGDWIGIYEMSNGVDYRDLGGDYSAWSWTCGEETLEECEQTIIRENQFPFEENTLEEGTYVAFLIRRDAPYVPLALSAEFYVSTECEF